MEGVEDEDGSLGVWNKEGVVLLYMQPCLCNFSCINLYHTAVELQTLSGMTVQGKQLHSPSSSIPRAATVRHSADAFEACCLRCVRSKNANTYLVVSNPPCSAVHHACTPLRTLINSTSLLSRQCGHMRLLNVPSLYV